MARTALTVQPVTSTGLNPTMTAANVDGHAIPLAGNLALLVRNGAVGAINVTVPTPVTQDGLALADRVVAVPAGQDRYIALHGNSAYQQADGSASIDFSAVTTITVALLQV